MNKQTPSAPQPDQDKAREYKCALCGSPNPERMCAGNARTRTPQPYRLDDDLKQILENYLTDRKDVHYLAGNTLESQEAYFNRCNNLAIAAIKKAFRDDVMPKVDQIIALSEESMAMATIQPTGLSTAALEQLIAERVREVLECLSEQAIEYSITNAEVYAHRTGYDGQMMIPLKAVTALASADEGDGNKKKPTTV